MSALAQLVVPSQVALLHQLFDLVEQSDVGTLLIHSDQEPRAADALTSWCEARGLDLVVRRWPSSELVRKPYETLVAGRGERWEITVYSEVR